MPSPRPLSPLSEAFSASPPSRAWSCQALNAFEGLRVLAALTLGAGGTSAPSATYRQSLRLSMKRTKRGEALSGAGDLVEVVHTGGHLKEVTFH